MEAKEWLFMTLPTTGLNTRPLHPLLIIILCSSPPPNALAMRDQESGICLYLLLKYDCCIRSINTPCVFIRWAIVRDENVARKMVKFIEVNTIGVSKESQQRAASVMEMISLSCQKRKPCDLENFFEYTHRIMAERWKRLRDTVKNSQLFHIPKFPSHYCKFSREVTGTYPGNPFNICFLLNDQKRVLTPFY